MIRSTPSGTRQLPEHMEASAELAGLAREFLARVEHALRPVFLVLRAPAAEPAPASVAVGNWAILPAVRPSFSEFARKLLRKSSSVVKSGQKLPSCPLTAR